MASEYQKDGQMLKINGYFIWVLLAFMLAVNPMPLHAVEKEILWQSYDSGMDKAKAANQPVFLYFYADWCGFCTKMGKETFQDEAVIDYLNANFTAVKVNSDKEQAIAKKYKIRGLPTTFLIDPDGKQTGPWPGYIAKEKLMALIKRN